MRPDTLRPHRLVTGKECASHSVYSPEENGTSGVEVERTASQLYENSSLPSPSIAYTGRGSALLSVLPPGSTAVPATQ